MLIPRFNGGVYLSSVDAYFQRSSSRGLGLRVNVPGRGGRGRMGRDSLGPGGVCYCPKCGYENSHVTGNPCYKIKCPTCGISLSRR